MGFGVSFSLCVGTYLKFVKEISWFLNRSRPWKERSSIKLLFVGKTWLDHSFKVLDLGFFIENLRVIEDNVSQFGIRIFGQKFSKLKNFVCAWLSSLTPPQNLPLFLLWAPPRLSLNHGLYCLLSLALFLASDLICGLIPLLPHSPRPCLPLSSTQLSPSALTSLPRLVASPLRIVASPTHPCNPYRNLLCSTSNSLTSFSVAPSALTLPLLSPPSATFICCLYPFILATSSKWSPQICPLNLNPGLFQPLLTIVWSILELSSITVEEKRIYGLI